QGERYFLSRPRRFGKSLMLSTLDAMFRGRKEYFKGLAAEEWVTRQSDKPVPVLRLDMSGLRAYSSGEELNLAIVKGLEDFNLLNDRNISLEGTAGGMLLRTIHKLYKQRGAVVVLIDEYDKPILDNLSDVRKANEMQEVLRSFYTVLKSCDEYLRFVFITGISKFSKMGVFSAMNNLEDISMDKSCGDIAGYTQSELEYYFADWLKSASGEMGITYDELIERLRDYYDGFCFDGRTRLYNPFSILQCLKKGEFRNYWYESGSPSFIVEWMREHHILDPEEYRHIVINSNDFISAQEIEQADAASFLYQSGYLTIEKKEEQLLTLDYPNREVRNSLSSMYLKLVYRVEGYALLGNEIWKALREGDISEIVRLYNIALAGVAYDDYGKNVNEFWYRSMFVMLLRGAGIISYSEPHTSKGRADVVIQFKNLTVVLEFKISKTSAGVDEMKRIGAQQIQERGYAETYGGNGCEIITAVLVADAENREVK
ncbi:MAG: AAA family ATPase, partial [Synergistaceae bacterium]|nr:AAA family ATPase [Synergistaceae bacterium]